MSYGGNLLVKNRNGLIVNAELLEANGRAERDAALLMQEQFSGDGRITVGGDKGFDTQEFAPHVAQKDGARTTRHAGYPVSQRKTRSCANLKHRTI